MSHIEGKKHLIKHDPDVICEMRSMSIDDALTGLLSFVIAASSEKTLQRLRKSVV